MSIKVAQKLFYEKNENTRKMMDFDTFIKIA